MKWVLTAHSVFNYVSSDWLVSLFLYFLDIDKSIPLHLLDRFLDELPSESEDELDNFDDEHEEAQAII